MSNGSGMHFTDTLPEALAAQYMRDAQEFSVHGRGRPASASSGDLGSSGEGFVSSDFLYTPAEADHGGEKAESGSQGGRDAWGASGTWDEFEYAAYVPQEIQDSGGRMRELAEGRVRVGMLLFVFGFIFAPCWWLGIVLPWGKEDDTMDRLWKQYNTLMTIFSVFLLAAAITMLVLGVA